MRIEEKREFYSRAYTAVLRCLENGMIAGFTPEDADNYAGAIADKLLARLIKMEDATHTNEVFKL